MKSKLNFLTITIISLLSILILSGCSLFFEEDPEPIFKDENQENKYDHVFQNDEPDDDPLVEDSLSDYPYMNQNSINGAYAYHLLTDEEQVLYTEIYDALTSHSEDVPVSSSSSDEIDYIFQCVLNDNPQIFHVSGYTLKEFSTNSGDSEFQISGMYTMTPEEVSANERLIENYTEECIASLPPLAGDYEKIKHVYEYVIENTVYDLSSIENQNIVSVCVYGYSVCQGYAKTVQYILNEMDIFCTLVHGTTNTGESHAWNLVKADDDYYYIDATWGEPSYSLTSYDESIVSELDINYEYLFITTEEIERTHTITNVVPMPECTEIKLNYYIKENLYFTELNEEKIADLITSANRSGKNYISLKCSSEEVLNRIQNEMIGNSKIFNYLMPPTTSVHYTINEDMYTLNYFY